MFGNRGIVGQVFASELGTGAGGDPVDLPLAGVTITVDGAEETLRAVTDAEGNFVLDPCPAGTFFVHIDGRTSPDSDWPDGVSYATRIRDLRPYTPEAAALLSQSARGLRGAGYVAFQDHEIPDRPRHSAIASTYAF